MKVSQVSVQIEDLFNKGERTKTKTIRQDEHREMSLKPKRKDMIKSTMILFRGPD